MSGYSTLRSRVALWLSLLLVVSASPLPLLAQGNAPAKPVALRVAVGACSDASGGLPAGVADMLQQSLLKSLADQRGFEVVGHADGARADRIVSARIVAASVPPDAMSAAQVRVIAESTDAQSGRLIFRAVVEGNGAGRPGQDPAARVERAVADAADQAASRLAKFQRLRGAVIDLSDESAPTINLGSDDGLAPGTALEVLRDGRVIGTLRLERVGMVTANGQLSDVPSGMKVQVGDQVRLASDLVPGEPTPLGEPTRKKHSNTWWIAALGVVVVGAIIGLAASGDSGPGLANGQIYVTAASPQIPADGVSSTAITASVRNSDGQPAKNGTRVEFETTLGLIAPARVAVLNGLAKTTLISAPTPGTATVTASAGRLQGTVQVTFGPTSVVAAHLTLNADPQAIPADGVSASTLTAVVSDGHHNPVPDGTVVAFATTRGALTAAHVPTVGGSAQALLRSTKGEGTARVTVSVGSLTRRTEVGFYSAKPAELAVTAAPAPIPANGVSTSTITALVSNSNHEAVPDGTVVTFSTSLGVIGPRNGQTVAGVATATLHSGTEPGTATVTVQVGSLSRQVTVGFSGPPAHLAVTANPPALPADLLSTSVITAVVTDATNHPVPDGTLVAFSTSLGLIDPASAPTQGGVATATLYSGLTVGLATVTVGVGTLTEAVQVPFLPPGP